MKGVKYSTSPHTLSALELRQEGQYKEALEKLNLAVSENDPVAMFLLAQAYEEGGWGLHKDVIESDKLYYKSACAGCPWAMIYCVIEKIIENSKQRRKIYKKALKYDDNWVLFLCYSKGCYDYKENLDLSNHYLKLAENEEEEEKYNPSHFMTLEFKDARCLHYAEQYEEAGFKQKFQKSLLTISATHTSYEMRLKANLETKIPENINQFLSTGNLHPKTMYKVGKYIRNQTYIYWYAYKWIDTCVNYYYLVYERYKKAVICWLICSKRLKLIPDLQRYIGKMIWNKRKSGVYLR